MYNLETSYPIDRIIFHQDKEIKKIIMEYYDDISIIMEYIRKDWTLNFSRLSDLCIHDFATNF